MLRRRARIKKKPAKTRRARARRPSRFAMFAMQLVICIMLVAAFMYWFGIYVQESGLFNVKEIEVSGAHFLSPGEIIAQAGVTSGDCIFLLRAEPIRQRVLALPHVKTCRVDRVFPDRVAIDIEERVAVATLLVNNRLYEIDRHCTVLRELAPEESHVGPFITVAKPLDYVEVGRRIDREQLARAVDVWRAFSRTTMADDVTVSEIAAEQGNKISMTCDELNCEIRWGRDNIDAQAWKLDVFWRSEKENLPFSKYIDLRFGNDVVCS